MACPAKSGGARVNTEKVPHRVLAEGVLTYEGQVPPCLPVETCERVEVFATTAVGKLTMAIAAVSPGVRPGAW